MSWERFSEGRRAVATHRITQQDAWHHLWAGAVLAVIEVAIPRFRNPLVTRARGAVFWMIFIVVAACSLRSSGRYGQALDVRAGLVLHIDAWFDRPYLRLVGVVVEPVTPAIMTHSYPSRQHAMPLFWRFHCRYHSIRDLNALNLLPPCQRSVHQSPIRDSADFAARADEPRTVRACCVRS